MDWDSILRQFDEAGLGQREFARRYGVPFNALHGRLWRREKNRRKGQSYSEHLFQSVLPPKLDVLVGDFAIVGDVHVPATRYDMAQLVSIVASKMLPSPRTLIIAGDLFNLDFASSYAHIIPPASWQLELQAARQLIREWFETFTSIILLAGNHERRLSKLTRGELGIEDIAAMLDGRVISTPYGWCMVQSGETQWRITHSSSYSVNTLTVGSELANRFGCNVISHHQHHLAKGFDRYKRYVVVDNGCLADWEKLAYVSLDDRRGGGMACGFTILKNGEAFLFGDHPFTNWENWVDVKEKRTRTQNG